MLTGLTPVYVISSCFAAFSTPFRHLSKPLLAAKVRSGFAQRRQGLSFPGTERLLLA